MLYRRFANRPSKTDQIAYLFNKLMSDSGLEKLLQRLTSSLAEDILVQSVTDCIRTRPNTNRVVLYYFCHQWSGRVTFKSLSSPSYSIVSATGSLSLRAYLTTLFGFIF